MADKSNKETKQIETINGMTLNNDHLVVEYCSYKIIERELNPHRSAAIKLMYVSCPLCHYIRIYRCICVRNYEW